MGFLRVSDNGRYFTRDGAPFFWMGDTIWPAVSRYSIAELEYYFAKRKEQGFTVAHIMLPWTVFDGSESSRDASTPPDDVPLWIDGDPSRPNEAYFDKLDEVIKLAADNGILLTVLPNGGGSGSCVDYKKIITAENAGAYGSWLGRRYKNEPNIAWVNGFDLPPWMYEDVTRAFNEGLMREDNNHLIFFHPCGGTSSNHFHSESWLAANFIQTWSDHGSVRGMIASDYNRKPAKPVVHAEGAYEAGTEYPSAPITSQLVREQAYNSYLSGASHTYGHNDLWRKTPFWRDALGSYGARQMKILKDIFAPLEWWRLTPDDTMVGPMFKRCHAAARADGGFAVIYFAHRTTATIDVSGLGGGASGVWIDPQTGESSDGGTFSGAEHLTTTPARMDDAVLLLEAK